MISTSPWRMVRSNRAWHVANALGAAFYVLDADFEAARVIVSGPGGIRDVLDFTFVSWTRPVGRSGRTGFYDRRHRLRSSQEVDPGSTEGRQMTCVLE